MSEERVPISVYSEWPHPVGSVEQVGDNKWCASTRHALLGHFLDRESAIEPLHAAIDGEGMTDARTFSRLRRCVLVDHFRIV
jgi:hypothetical protein